MKTKRMTVSRIAKEMDILTDSFKNSLANGCDTISNRREEPAGFFCQQNVDLP